MSEIKKKSLSMSDVTAAAESVISTQVTTVASEPLRELESNSSATTLDLCKKFKRIKYEIDMQNYKINKLRRELKSHKIPPKRVKQIEDELKIEMCKLGEMIQHAMKEQSLDKEENCIWGPIAIDSDNENAFLIPPKTPSGISDTSGFNEYAYTELLLSDNEALGESVYKLQESVLRRDETACCLQRKIAYLNQQIEKLTKGNEKVASKMDDKTVNQDKLKLELQHYTNLAETISCNISRMEMYVKELHSEFNCLKKCKQADKHVQDKKMEAKPNDLQNQYSTLLQSYCQKEKEHDEAIDRLKKCLKKSNTCEQTETEFLRKEAEKLVNEIEDYKLMIKELQSQMELYRDKFLKAQERVEKQKIQLKKLECSKYKIEDQVNEEMKKIKKKFEEKLFELCPFPAKFEESQKELEMSKIKIKELEEKLCDMSGALSKAKCELKELNNQPQESTVKKHEKLEMQIEELKRKEATRKKTKECLEEKLCHMKSELENLRTDSSKIISITKCCAEKNRQILHEQINCLEMELVQCRAAASLSLAEKNEMIGELKDELRMLCEHFKNSQDQINQLKQQIVNLTENRYQDSDCYQIFANK